MSRMASRTSREHSDSPSSTSAPTSLEVLVTGWVRDGVISPAQGRAILAGGDRPVSLPSWRGRGHSLVVEALGYLGGAIVVAAVVLISARYWDELGDGGRVAVLAVGSIALVGAGALLPVRRGQASARLRAVLWLASTVTVAASLGVLGDAWLDLHAAGLALFVGVGTTAYAGVLWWRWRSGIQQAAAVMAAALAAAALLAQLSATDSLPGLGPWTVGVVWWLLAWGGLTTPPRLGQLGGAAIAIGGAMATAGSDAGTWLVLVTLVAVVWVGLVLRDVWQLGVGALGVVLNVPQAVERWFPGSLAAPLVLLVVGTAVVGFAVYAARRGSRRAGGEAERPDGSPGSPSR